MNKLTQLLLLAVALSLSHSIHSLFHIEKMKKKRYILISNRGVTLRTKVHLEEKKSHFPINRENAHWNSSNQSQLQSLFITSMCSSLFHSLLFFFRSHNIKFYYLPRELSSHSWPVCVYVGPFHIHIEYSYFFLLQSKWEKCNNIRNGIKWNEQNGQPVQLASMKIRKKQKWNERKMSCMT